MVNMCLFKNVLSPRALRARGPRFKNLYNRNYTTLSSNTLINDINYIKKYENAYDMSPRALRARGPRFKLIGSFVSARKAAKFLEISGSTVMR